MTIQEMAAIVAMGTTATLAIRFTWTRGIHPKIVEPARAHFARIDAMVGNVAALAKGVENIQHALGPNGGKSLADAVNRTEATVRELAARQRMIVAAMPMPVFEVDKRGWCVDVNRAYLDLLDVDRASALGMEWVNLIHLDDRDAVLRQWQHAIRDERAFIHTYRYATRPGGLRCHVEAQPIRSEDGRVLGWYGILSVAIGIEYVPAGTFKDDDPGVTRGSYSEAKS